MKRLLALGVILILAGLLRFYNLSTLPNGLHWDEQDTGYQAFSLIKTGRDYFGNPLPFIFHSFADYRTPVFIYSAVPFVAAFGLTPLAVRLPSAIYGLLSVLLIYYLANLLFEHLPLKIRNLNLNVGHLAAFALAVSIWQVLYARQSVECNAMLTFMLLGLVAFYKSLADSRWLWVSGLSFGLAVASYSPAKFFVPLLVVFLIMLYMKRLFSLPRRHLLLFVICFALLTAPIEWDGFFGLSGTRFHDLSILTDPTLASAVNYQRQYSNAAKGHTGIGQTPNFLDRLTYNKPQLILSTFFQNYLDVYSTQYLFTKGDQNLRQSPDRDAIGQFFESDVLPFVLGLFALTLIKFVPRKSAYLLAFWFLVGPIPSALTRGGGAHAARTFLLLPAFIFTISIGIYYLFSKSRVLFSLYLVLLAFSLLNTYNYFFGIYRFESAPPFQWGFDQAVKLAITNSPRYSHVVVDLDTDSAIMAYLFTTRMSPAAFQALEPLPTVRLTSDLSGVEFGNILLLPPGSRTWTDIIKQPGFPKNTLIISDARQPLIDTQVPHLQTVLYPDSTPFLYLFTPR